MTRLPTPSSLPEGVEHYRSTADFTEASLPAALRRDHVTKDGAWGLIRVAEGRLAYRITDPRREPAEAVLAPDAPPGVIEPTMLHHVEPLGPVRFRVEFYRLPA